jgi:hypothetical protein
VTLCALHAEAEVEGLLDALATALDALPEAPSPHVEPAAPLAPAAGPRARRG